MGGGVDADIVHAENKSDEMMTIKISMRDFFIEMSLLVGAHSPFYLIFYARNQSNNG
jgi:hypothetical protein